MSSSNDLLSLLSEQVSKVKISLHKLKKYKSNSHYKESHAKEIQRLNRHYNFFKAKTKSIQNQAVQKKIDEFSLLIESLITKGTYEKQLKTIEKLELFWPEIEVEISQIKSIGNTFVIPSEIPMNEQRLDLEEAIRDYDNGCYISSLVLCRRAYEGSLVEKYRSKTNNEPVGDANCQHCGKIIRAKSYMGIGKLHNWAIKEKIITEKLKQVGFLVSDIGAGGAHPPLEEFPRDSDIAKLGITATITLLKQIYGKK